MLVEALVALAMLAAIGALIYHTGASLLARTESDLDRSAALTNLHTIALFLGARGQEAAALVPFEDERFEYAFIVEPVEERLDAGTGSGFYWATVSAVDLRTHHEVTTLSLGFHN